MERRLRARARSQLAMGRQRSKQDIPSLASEEGPYPSPPCPHTRANHFSNKRTRAAGVLGEDFKRAFTYKSI